LHQALVEMSSHGCVSANKVLKRSLSEIER
jgi:hypothetical protein